MIRVLRIGHRLSRDKRVTTHVALVARAFGADEIYIDTKDERIENTIKSICKRFGGTFKIRTGINTNDCIKNWKGKIIHLTMYGDDLDNSIKQIRKYDNLLIIVGAEKVPPHIYQKSDYNVSIGNQPHSEVSALAIFLDRYKKGKWKDLEFSGNMKIIPCKKGKVVISNDKKYKYSK